MGSRATILLLFLVFSFLAYLKRTSRAAMLRDLYVPYLWIFFLLFGLQEFISFRFVVWGLAVLSFVTLREYFTLVDLRLQDRLGILGAYLSIPFMFYFIDTDWYGMFIISIPVYSFLVVPFLLTLGGPETRGTLLSTGIIDAGLFLLVYCIGHIGYLARYSVWMAVSFVLGVAACDLIAYLLKSRVASPLRRALIQYASSIPAVTFLMLAMSGWSGIPVYHSAVLGFLVPALVAVGRHTMLYIEADLGIESLQLLPGKGQLMSSLGSFLYAAPVVFHYIRYYLK